MRTPLQNGGVSVSVERRRAKGDGPEDLDILGRLGRGRRKWEGMQTANALYRGLYVDPVGNVKSTTIQDVCIREPKRAKVTRSESPMPHEVHRGPTNRHEAFARQTRDG